ncbi:MAG: hypothetical protein DYG88_18150 [Chloroflexi bacterium CFX4]|nr:hypothetical protein [Chloroflexi bacterium CFX4]
MIPWGKRALGMAWLGLALIGILWLSGVAGSAPTLNTTDTLVRWQGEERAAEAQTLARGRIVFVSERNGNPEIYVMDATGGSVRRLTRNNARDDSPAWSPDGRMIAFVSERDGNREIYSMNASGGSLIRLTRNVATDESPAWSPDGRQIAFVSERDGIPQIYVMRADGGGVRRLTETDSAETQPMWSPDGRQIAFVSERDGNPEIYVMRADGSNMRRLTSDPSVDSAPRWSPDGRMLLFVSEREGAQLQIFSMTSSGGDVKLISVVEDSTTRNFAPAWSPDGTWIAFTSNRDGYEEIYAMRADGSGVRNLTRNRASDYSPSWAITSPGSGGSNGGGSPSATPTPLGGGRQIGMNR